MLQSPEFHLEPEALTRETITDTTQMKWRQESERSNGRNAYLSVPLPSAKSKGALIAICVLRCFVQRQLEEEKETEDSTSQLKLKPLTKGPAGLIRLQLVERENT
jgi:hypothetical protein